MNDRLHLTALGISCFSTTCPYRVAMGSISSLGLGPMQAVPMRGSAVMEAPIERHSSCCMRATKKLNLEISGLTASGHPHGPYERTLV
jgi:hypothetical protein